MKLIHALPVLALMSGASTLYAAPGDGATASAPTSTATAPARSRLIVLDPGHGGSNLGAPGVRAEVHEKDVTMALARALASRLEQRGFAVILTRDRDRYLTLRERVQIANRVGADVFVSLHANASPTHGQRGYETWILSANAVDVDSRALRTGDGAERPGVDTATALLLDDLERGAAQWESAELAAEVQDQLAAVRGADGDRGVRQESKHVLLGATMPAILAEVGFVDHPAEGRDLLDPVRRAGIADALARAIDAAVTAE